MRALADTCDTCDTSNTSSTRVDFKIMLHSFQVEMCVDCDMLCKSIRCFMCDVRG